MPKISVIVPVYNAQEYLDECILSILGQTYRDIELVLVNDGSQDASGKICDNYAEKDNRVKVIHKKNEGVSKARNIGIQHATGDYLAFVDSDDFIDINTYKRIIDLRNQYDAEICVSNKILHKKTYCTQLVTVHQREDALTKLLSVRTEEDDSIPCSMCGGIYKRVLFDNILFPDDIHHYEDYYMQVVLANKANKIVTTTEQFYYYRIREGSANHVDYNHKTASCLLIAKRLKDEGIIRTQLEYDNVHSFFISQCFFSYLLSKQKDRIKTRELQSVIIKGFNSIKRSMSIKKSIKAAMLMFIVMPKTCNIVVRKKLGK